MRKRILSLLQYVVFLGLGLFLLWYTTRNLSDEEIAMMKTSLLESKFLVIIPAMIALLASHYSRAMRWKILMEPLGFQPTTTNTFFAVMLGYFFNLLVPRLGEVMKCTLLAKYEKAPVDKLIGTMVAERAFDVICMLIVIFLTIIIQLDLVGGYASAELVRMFSGKVDPVKIGLSMLVLVLALLAFRFVMHRFAHISIIARVKAIIKGVWEGLTSVMNVKRRMAFFLHSIFIWTMYLISIRLGFYAMDSVAHLGIKPSFTILSFGSLAMIVTQGGIGAYQLAVQKTLLLYGISEVNGLAFGWLLWLVQTLMVLGAGLICLFLLPLINRKPHEGNLQNKGKNI
jgi:hypothetical protein